MKRRRVAGLTAVLATVAALVPVANVFGVHGPNAVATNGFPWVVDLRFGSIGSGFRGSGSYITNGVVLTCSHNINSEPLVTGLGVTNNLGQTFERVTIDGQKYYALGVQNPFYGNASADPHDIGLYLVLNGPAVPGGVLPVLATTNDAPLTTGSSVAVLGFGLSTNTPLPIFGTLTMTNATQTAVMAGGQPNVTSDTYAFTRPPSSELTDSGDSGGPYIANYGGTNKIVAVHTTGFSTGGVKTAAMGVRVDSHLDFVKGNGDAGQAVLVRLAGAANTTWSTAASWLRAATNFNAVPQGGDVVVLDPTTGSDAGTVVDVDVDTANLRGLLTDVTLNVNGRALNVPGRSGVLNAGNLHVGGAAGSKLVIGASLDNVGTLQVSQNGQALIGLNLPTGYVTFDTALLNNSNATVAVTAGGVLAVTNGSRRAQILNADASSVVTVVGGPAGKAELIGDVFDNYGQLEVKDRAILDLARVIFNEPTGQFLLSGGASGQATGDVFRLINWGTVNVSTDGVLVAEALIRNLGLLNVNGGSVLTTNLILSFATNLPAKLTGPEVISTTGRVVVSAGNVRVRNHLLSATLQVETGTFTMNGGFADIDRLIVTNATGEFSLNGGVVTSHFTRVFNGRDFHVGSNAVPATLALMAGSHQFTNSLLIAATPDATGTVHFAGTALAVTNGSLMIGWKGVGVMTVTNGNVFAGHAHGPKPVALGGHSGAKGTLYILNNGTFTAVGPLRVGDDTNATGAVWINGGTLVASNAFTFIGLRGPGQMTLSNGTVWLGGTVVGTTNGAPGLLTIAGGSLETGGFFPGLTLGDGPGGTGSVLVTGGSVTITNGSTIIGNRGVGQLIISNVLVETRDVTIASNLTASGTLTLNNGTLATIGLVNNTNGLVRGVGTIDGPVVSAGKIAPGFSAGKLFITGDLTLQSTSIVLMELGGTADTDYDQVNINGQLQADGTLTVQLINGFNPGLGDTFDIFDFSFSAGGFAVTNLPALMAGLYWDTSALLTLGQLTVIPEPATGLLTGLALAALLGLRRRPSHTSPGSETCRR